MSEKTENYGFNKPELALPAGSLQCALYAFKGGADAVYLGLKDFSARKGAVNFTFDDARKLKEVCRTQNKKFYITLNTLLYDNELSQAYSMLKQLDYLQPDGIIVQDLGIAKIIRDEFPNLQLHGSTQLAVHTTQGVKELQDLGFSRVVLSRELSFEEIQKIRQECPNIELKVFIHGALCYGFSGLCMASETITGRSANRGACAQVCRTWFSNPKESYSSCSSSWLFSMKDLCLGRLIQKYKEIGIDSLKVEGRMKGPEYVYWCAKFYSLLLNGLDESNKEVQWAKECMQTSFSRETTLGFFNTKTNGSCNAENMVCSAYPSHKGIQVGTIEKVLSSKAIIKFSKPVALRDGLLVVSQGEKTMESSGFGLSFIEGGRSFISEGETTTINFPTSNFTKKPSFGTSVFCTSRHNQNLPLLSENINEHKKPIDLIIRLTPTSICINGKDFDCPMQQANNKIDLKGNFEKIFQASDKSLFTAGNIHIENQSGFESPFIPLSLLKQIRREFYAVQDSIFEKSLLEFPSFITQKTPTYTESCPLPKRSTLGLWDKITYVENFAYLPLSPIMFNEEEYFSRLDDKTKDVPDIIIGINNIAQVRWAKQHPDIRVFADIFLYTANALAYEALKEEMPNLVGSYEKRFDNLDEEFKVPLFISRVCMRHHGMGLSCKGCTKDNNYKIAQNGKKYNVTCKDCITVVTEEK